MSSNYIEAVTSNSSIIPQFSAGQNRQYSAALQKQIFR